MSETSENIEKRRLMIKRGSGFVRAKLHGKIFLIPSCITVVSLFCGFLAIISAIGGHWEYAAKCILLSIIFDGMDGRVARTLNATSAFGREFDSLSDLVAFGVAPATLVYCWAFSRTADEFGVLVCFLFVVCGAARLARFNITTTDEPKSYFTGLPIPGAAGAVIAMVYAYPQAVMYELAVGLVFLHMALLSVLMVSTLPFFSLKKIKITKDSHRLYLLIGLAFTVAIAWKFNRLAFFIGATLYALSGPIQYVFEKRRKKMPRNDLMQAS